MTQTPCGKEGSQNAGTANGESKTSHNPKPSVGVPYPGANKPNNK